MFIKYFIIEYNKIEVIKSGKDNNIYVQQKRNKTYIIKKKVEKLSVRKKTLTRSLNSSAFCGTTYILYNVEFHLKAIPSATE